MTERQTLKVHKNPVVPSREGRPGGEGPRPCLRRETLTSLGSGRPEHRELMSGLRNARLAKVLSKFK